MISHFQKTSPESWEKQLVGKIEAKNKHILHTPVRDAVSLQPNFSEQSISQLHLPKSQFLGAINEPVSCLYKPNCLRNRSDCFIEGRYRISSMKKRQGPKQHRPFSNKRYNSGHDAEPKRWRILWDSACSVPRTSSTFVSVSWRSSPHILLEPAPSCARP